MALDDNKVIIEVDLLAEDARAKAEGLGKDLRSLKDANKDLAKANQQTSVAYQQNAQQIQVLQRQQKAYIALTQSQTGSNVQLRAQLSLLNRQYDELGREQRETTTSGKALQLQIAAINGELLKSEGATGRFQRNVGNYASSIGSGIQQFASSVGTPGGFGFAPQALTGAYTALTQSVGFATKAVKDQQIANELLKISNDKAAESASAQAEAERIATEATIAKTRAEEAAVRAEALRAEADSARLVIENQLVIAEERAAAVTAQLIIEEAAIVAEEELRVAAEQQLAAVQLELVATEEARVATEIELAASTAATGAASAAAASKSTALGSSFRAAGSVILATIILIGAAVVSFLSRLDSFSDGIEQLKSRASAGTAEFGRQITNAFDNGGVFGVLKRLTTSFGDVARATRAASDEAAKYTEKFQALEDRTDINEQLNQQTQNEVQQLRIRARNRSLDNQQRAELLAQADQLERSQFETTKKLHQDIIDETVTYANTTGRIRYQLTEDDKKQLRAGNIARANELLNAEKIDRDAYKKLKDAYAQRNQDQQQANMALEKIQNDQDKYAEQQKAKEEKRAADIEKINEDRLKSEQLTNTGILTARQKDFAAINDDINKRVELYRKYGQSTVQLEEERNFRISQSLQKFHTEDLKQIRANLNEAETIRIAGIQDNAVRTAAQQAQANNIAIAAIDDNIMQLSARAALGEQGLTDLLDSYVQKRNTLVEQGNLQREQAQTALQERLRTLEEAGYAANYEQMVEQMRFEQEQADARLAINEQLAGSYENLFGTIAGLAGQNTVIGKLALVAQKSFAIAEIAINAQREISAINLRYELLKVQAAAIPFAGPFIVAGLTVAQAAETGVVAGRAIVAGVIIAAQTIASVIPGKARGGLHYESDGRGQLLRGPGTGTSDSMNARLSNGEVVINARSASMFRPELSAINEAGGGVRFARGGQYGGTFVQGLSGQVNNSAAISDAVMQAMKNVNILVTVEDINSAQAKQVKVVNDATF